MDLNRSLANKMERNISSLESERKWGEFVLALGSLADAFGLEEER